MARVSYGDDVKARVRQLLEKLLAYANDEIENGERFKIGFNWQTPKQLVVRTQLRVLAELSGLDKEQVREVLKALAEFLGVLEDLREHKRGSENWHFKLTLWCDKSDKDGNLSKFDAEWQSHREAKPGVQRAEARKPKPKSTFYENIPLSGVVEFVGREDELQNLHQMLQENNQVAIAAIAGMGGLGKTELALQYAKAHRETYKGGICWLLAKAGDVGIQVVQFARTQLDLNPPENLTEDSNQKLLAQVQYCFRHWREGDVLLVLDDVSDYEQVKPYLPSPSSRFKVLMTTRQYFGGIAQLPLKVLQLEAALELLKSLLKETPERIEKELAVANQLCEWLGCLPLGLELVGRYLARKRDLSLIEMLRRLKEKRLDERSLCKSKSEGNMTAQRGVLAAFELSWQELEDDDKHLGCLVSLFAAAPIPWKLVEQCLKDDDTEYLEEIRDDSLLNLHLLQRKGEGTYQLHPLLREFFQHKFTGLDRAENFKRWFCKVMVAVAKEIPQYPILEQITAVSPVIPHLAEVAKNLIQYVSDDDLLLPFMGNAAFYKGRGLYDQAALWLEQCLKVTKKRLGEEHPDVAESLNNLAEIYRLQGKYKESELKFKEVLALDELFQRQEHPIFAQTLNNLGNIYKDQGLYAEAETLHRQALALKLCLLGYENLSVAKSLNNLAEIYRLQVRYTEAEALYQQALTLFQRLRGEEDSNVCKILNNLALLYGDQGKYSEAEPLYQQVLELKRRLQGEEHPDVAISLVNLAGIYESQGRDSEAEPLLMQALEIFERGLGLNHQYAASCRKNLVDLRDRLASNQE